MTSTDHGAPISAAPMRRLMIRVRGMVEPRCAASVASALGFINGVSEVDVSLKEGRALLNLDARKAEPAQLRTAIYAVGFEAMVFEDSNEDMAGGQAA